MIQGILGFFGSVIGAVAGLIATAAGLTFLVVLWKSGSLPVVLSWPAILLEGFFRVAAAVLGFFGDLVKAF